VCRPDSSQNRTEKIRAALEAENRVAATLEAIAYLPSLYQGARRVPSLRRLTAGPVPRARALVAQERRAALALQWEYAAWRRAAGLEPDPAKVRAVDRVIGDLYEAGDYAFPALHRDET
jgi:hypothetical protein